MNITIVTILLFLITFSDQLHAIRNSEVVDASKYPSYVYLENCGSVKVFDNILLTAAHCAHKEFDSSETIELSDSFEKGQALNMKDRDHNELQVAIHSVHFHPSYRLHKAECKRIKECLDMALIVLDTNDHNIHDFYNIQTGEFAKEEELAYAEKISFTGSGLNSFSYNYNSLISGVFFVSASKKHVSLDQQLLRSHSPSRYYLNDFEISIYPESQSFFSREAPILLKGDSGAPVYNSKGEIIAINSFSSVLTSKSVAKKIHAKVAAPMLEWMENIIVYEGF